MKTKYIKGTLIICFTALLFFSSCLKDERYFNPAATQAYIAELPLSGLANFSADAVTAPGPLDTIAFVVNIASINPPTTATKVTVGVDNSLIAPYNTANPAIAYNTLPMGSYIFNDITVTIPAGSRQSGVLSVVIDKSKLDPAQSYMLPVKIKDAAGMTISGNYSTHYYHIIGNDFAGTYTYQYRRYQNGTGPGAGAIPSLGQGSTPDITNTAGSTTVLSPVSATEFKMVTNYNGQGVMYDVTFTRTVGASGVISYSNWNVTFSADDLAKWAASGITNMTPPKFTVPPPATNSDPKKFELNYVSGGASGRYIDDTYFK